MDYKKGDRVRHPSKDDWGLGEVLALVHHPFCNLV
jgi:hypothetical protein